jgi:hypothetical protein
VVPTVDMFSEMQFIADILRSGKRTFIFRHWKFSRARNNKWNRVRLILAIVPVCTEWLVTLLAKGGRLWKTSFLILTLAPEGAHRIGLAAVGGGECCTRKEFLLPVPLFFGVSMNSGRGELTLSISFSLRASPPPTVPGYFFPWIL